ncbi:hypothetical protein ACLRGF_10890 [Mycetocola zhadangensis]|uniref:hypothetical protein n=1 Tax=Mycetocola zhadangensis TaxID=1164595 RepID=UPI003A4E3FC1
METVRNAASTRVRTDALTARTRRRDVRAFYRAFAAQHPSVRQPATVARRVIVVLGAAVVPIGLLAMGTGISQEIAEASPDMVSELVAMFAICGLFLIAGGTLGWAAVRLWSQRGTPERHYRLAWFATQNGMSYTPGPMPGTHITPWTQRGALTLTRVMRPLNGTPIEFANYELRSGSAGSTNTGFGGICSIRLPSSLPHILLQSHSDRPALASAAPARSQVLSLEGDFDKHFTLYCPEGYEQDALYLFTPDVMAHLIDRVHGFDVEIIDDWMFLESSRDVVTTDPDTWRRVLTAADALGDKAVRWARWRETRRDSSAEAPLIPHASAEATRSVAAPARVGRGGKRLRMTLGGGAILGTVLTGAYVLAVIVSNAVR